MKLLGCSGVSYDRIATSPTNNIVDTKILWLERIEEVTDAMSELNLKLEAYNSFKIALTEKEKLVLDLYYMKQNRGSDVARQLGVSKVRIIDIRKNILIKYIG
jgi:DNA-directed RNA polymerase specialized sigma subunit